VSVCISEATPGRKGRIYFIRVLRVFIRVFIGCFSAVLHVHRAAMAQAPTPLTPGLSPSFTFHKHSVDAVEQDEDSEGEIIENELLQALGQDFFSTGSIPHDLLPPTLEVLESTS
jgi:hypothetical protein